MKCCVSTDVETRTNLLTFELDPDHSPDAGTGLLSPISHRLWHFAALPKLPASHGFKMALFTEPLEDLRRR